jgi:hypothetical protein
VGKGRRTDYLYKVYNTVTDFYEFYQRYDSKDRNCVVLVIKGTNEAPGKFIRFFELDNGKHVAHCFAPNGNSLQCREYDTLNKAKMDDVNYILNGKTKASSLVDPNAYPLSKKQLTNGINQLNIKECCTESELQHRKKIIVDAIIEATKVYFSSFYKLDHYYLMIQYELI